MNEALRYDPPASVNTPVYLKQDAKVGKYNFKTNDRIMINIYGLHFNPSQWQRPTEFLPERFDSTNELSKTPDGKKRSPSSFAPFNGGPRICLGKTFAEANLKILNSYLTQNFDFEHVNEKF